MLRHGLWLLPFFIIAQAEAQSPPPCPQGRTMAGTCASPVVLQSMQQRAVVFTQSKISYLGLPLDAPSNSYADAARDRQSLKYGIDQRVPTTTSPAPAPGTFIRLPSNVSPASLQISAPYTIVPGGIRIR
jgi:hypothetical protein